MKTIKWNKWKPGGGRRGGQHSLDKPIPQVRDKEGHPLIGGSDGKWVIDFKKLIEEANATNKIN